MSKLHEVKFKNELINHLLKLRHMQIGSRMKEGCIAAKQCVWLQSGWGELTLARSSSFSEPRSSPGSSSRKGFVEVKGVSGFFCCLKKKEEIQGMSVFFLPVKWQINTFLIMNEFCDRSSTLWYESFHCHQLYIQYWFSSQTDGRMSPTRNSRVRQKGLCLDRKFIRSEQAWPSCSPER